jgi:hypothetical protein
MRCAKQAWKQIFIMLTYANMNMKKTWQGYGVKLCLRLMLNRLNEMKGPTSIYTPLKTYLKKTSKKVSMCASIKEASWNLSNWKSTMN